MALKLIGAGLPRTGTMSLKHVLERLLAAPCHHVVETFEHPEHVGVWAGVLQRVPPGWEPLCDALGVAGPDEELPHESTTADFRRRAADRRGEQPHPVGGTVRADGGIRHAP